MLQRHNLLPQRKNLWLLLAEHNGLFFFFMQLFKLIGQKHVGAPQGLGPRKTWHCTVTKSKKTRKNSAVDILLSIHFPQAQRVLPANQVHKDHVVLQV